MQPVATTPRTFVDLPEKPLNLVLLDLDLRSLRNCSLTCSLLNLTIQTDNFWQKKSYFDFAPVCQPVRPFKVWYELQYNRKQDEAQDPKLPKKVQSGSDGWFMNSGDMFFVTITLMNKPNQLYALVEKSISSLSKPLREISSPIFLVGYNGILARAAAAFRSCSYEEQMNIGDRLVNALPEHIRKKVYYEYEQVSSVEGADAFKSTNADLPLKALAIENYLFMNQS